MATSLSQKNIGWSWAFYDFANSAFATTVLAGFFPIFFKQYWCLGAMPALSTARLGYANALAGLLVALLAPMLGAMADQGAGKKHFLFAFAGLGMAMSASLFFIGQGQWLWALGCFALALIGYSGANVFYDALLVEIALPEKRDWISSLGFGLGYIGGGLLFALNVWMVLHPQLYGFKNSASAIHFAFLTVGLWWALFSLPLLLWVRETRRSKKNPNVSYLTAGWRQLWQTFKTLRLHKIIFWFLLAYWLYIDGVFTVITMAIDYGLAIGLNSTDLILALLITQFIGFPAALGFGAMGNRFGPKKLILLGIAVYAGVTIWAGFMHSTWEFYGLAVVIGLVQGGVQSLSRSWFANLIPAGQAAEFFGFYNMVGKFAAILGPALVASVALLMTGLGLASHLASRLSIASLLALFVLGAILLWRIPVKTAA